MQRRDDDISEIIGIPVPGEDLTPGPGLDYGLGSERPQDGDHDDPDDPDDFDISDEHDEYDDDNKDEFMEDFKNWKQLDTACMMGDPESCVAADAQASELYKLDSHRAQQYQVGTATPTAFPQPSTYTWTASATPSPSSEYSNSFGPSPDAQGGSGGSGGLNKGLVVAAILLPVAFIIILALGAFIYFRRRSRTLRDRNSRSAMTMKMNETSYSPVTEHGPQPVQMRMTEQSTVNLPSQPPITNVPTPEPYTRPQSIQPIILGPMRQSGAGNYHTGLDADVLSISDSTIMRSGGFEDSDEPPPPYRPRSVVSFVSRESSMRHGSIGPIPEANESTQHLIHNHALPVRSPFADPDDDGISIISQPARQGNSRLPSNMSDVSDLSYQNSIRRI